MTSGIGVCIILRENVLRGAYTIRRWITHLPAIPSGSTEWKKYKTPNENNTN